MHNNLESYLHRVICKLEELSSQTVYSDTVLRCAIDDSSDSVRVTCTINRRDYIIGEIVHITLSMSWMAHVLNLSLYSHAVERTDNGYAITYWFIPCVKEPAA